MIHGAEDKTKAASQSEEQKKLNKISKRLALENDLCKPLFACVKQ